MRRKCLFVLLTVLYLFAGIFRQDFSVYARDNNDSETSCDFTETLYARAAVLLDADSGRVLFGKNEDELMPMASTTKILTCIVALEQGDLKDLVSVSGKAAGMPKVKLYMKEGEQYRLEDLLYSLMLESHNDTAVAIAEHIGGSLEQFAVMMNHKAGEIGCTRSFFITPNGLDSTATVGSQLMTHGTTAKELAQIMAYCIEKSEKSEEFLKITGTMDYSFSNKHLQEDGSIQDGSRSFSCHNHNAFLTMMEGALSGKTGFTGKAGYCYVGALKRDNRTFVVALLACGWPNNKSYKWSDTTKLMNYGLEQYTYHSFIESELEQDKLKPITVEKGQTKKIGERAFVSLKEEMLPEGSGMLLRKDEKLQLIYELPKTLAAPVKKGQKIGRVKYVVEGETFCTVELTAAGDIDEIDMKWCWEQVCNRFFISLYQNIC